ncbi:hypothetical protein NL460_28580, partial [Klebsiella pneumoniae]|nr:hypothetical protein [Klebsiella pneumoniae]
MTQPTDFGDIAGAEPVPPLAAPLADDDLRAQITRLGPWFHNIQLAPGIATREIASSVGPQPVDHPIRRWRVYED